MATFGRRAWRGWTGRSGPTGAARASSSDPEAHRVGESDPGVVELEREPVDHVDHAVDAVDQAHSDRDQAPALQDAFERHQPVAHLHRDAVRVDPEDALEHLVADLAADV